MQPDLGTATILLMLGGGIFFIAGVRLWKFIVITLAGLSALPVAWSFLRDYQKDRILIFLDPSSDPLGSGYHITQSKIAFGNGGFSVRGSSMALRLSSIFCPNARPISSSPWWRRRAG